MALKAEFSIFSNELKVGRIIIRVRFCLLFVAYVALNFSYGVVYEVSFNNLFVTFYALFIRFFIMNLVGTGFTFSELPYLAASMSSGQSLPIALLHKRITIISDCRIVCSSFINLNLTHWYLSVNKREIRVRRVTR